MRARTRDLIAQVLDVDPARLSPNPSAADFEQWDSLHHLELMLLLEEEFGVEIPSELVPSLVSLGEIVAFLQEAVHGARADGSLVGERGRTQ